MVVLDKSVSKILKTVNNRESILYFNFDIFLGVSNFSEEN